MSRLFILVFIVGCSYEVTSENEPSKLESPPTVQKEPPVEPEPLEAGPVDPDACVPQRFAADQIPYGFQLDPNCPPDIYAPPRWIPKWDPGPIINAN